MFRIIKLTQINGLNNFFSKRFAGHSKWANIKHIKGLKDAQKAQNFTRMSRLIKVAIQEGKSTNPEANLKLQQAIEQAKRLNMPVASIQNVLKTSQINKNEAKKHVLELRGPGGCIILVELFTDNLTKCKQILATFLKKLNTKYADSGAKHIFDYKGIVDCEFHSNLANKSDDDVYETCTEHAIYAGAEDVEIIPIDEKKKLIRFICDPNQVHAVAATLQNDFSYVCSSKSAEYFAKKSIQINDEDLSMYEKLCEKLENITEVINVYDNIQAVE